MQSITQVEEIQFREPVALLKGSKGMELLAGKQVSGVAGLLLLEQGANQGEGSVEDGEQGKRCKALKGSDLPLHSAGTCDPTAGHQALHPSPNPIIPASTDVPLQGIGYGPVPRSTPCLEQ